MSAREMQKVACALEALPEEERALVIAHVTRHLEVGRGRIIDAALEAMGRKPLSEGWPKWAGPRDVSR